MEPWLSAVLELIHEAAGAGRVKFTHKARAEMSDVLHGLAGADVVDVLGHLAAEDFFERVRSKRDDDWLYVFKPEVFDVVVYVKLALRLDCVVVSFHEDGPAQEDEVEHHGETEHQGEVEDPE